MKEERKYDIFISYRRDGGQVTARILRDSLTERGYNVFFDVESLRSGAFNTKLYSVIEECTDFILILSPNALDRCVEEEDWVRCEVEHALRKKKNIIPILLREFAFPADLPPSLKELPYRNGLAANLEYYDAFVDKLETFLHTKKTFWKHLSVFVQSRVKRKILWIAAVLSIFALLLAWFFQYPRTTEQISLTNGVITNVSYNLTILDVLADAQHDMLQAAKAYLETGDDDALSTQLALCYNTLTDTDLTKVVPTENLLDWMMDSPFSGDDLAAMHDQLSVFRQEGLDNLAFVEFILSDECMLDVSDKLHYVELYEELLEENRQAFAYATNELLLPVTREKYLETLWTETLPYLEEIPLNGRNWSRNKNKLIAAQEACLDNMETTIQDMNAIVNKSSNELQNMKTYTHQELTDNGFTEERATKIVSYMSHDWSTELAGQYVRQGYSEEDASALAQEEAARKDWELDVLLSFSARIYDDVNTIWEKMIYLMDLGFYDEAEECIILYQAKMTNSDRYMPGLALFLQLRQQGTLEYGIMVMDYYEEDGINDQLMIGDILYQFNENPCRNTAEYLSMKAAVTTGSYTVKLLRLDQDHQIQVLELTLPTDSPRVYFNDLVPTSDQMQ